MSLKDQFEEAVAKFNLTVMVDHTEQLASNEIAYLWDGFMQCYLVEKNGVLYNVADVLDCPKDVSGFPSYSTMGALFVECLA